MASFSTYCVRSETIASLQDIDIITNKVFTFKDTNKFSGFFNFYRQKKKAVVI